MVLHKIFGALSQFFFLIGFCSISRRETARLNRRGTLIPLYPTLAGQVGAIAREYGLPSTGGIVVYLVETSSPLVDGGMGHAFIGGPRIGDEAWSLLWSQLFEEEDASMRALEVDDEDGFFDNRLYDDAGRRIMPPPVPPIPPLKPDT